MNVSKPRPTDHPLLIVFVIGGVTATELKQVKETLAASTSKVQVRTLHKVTLQTEIFKS